MTVRLLVFFLLSACDLSNSVAQALGYEFINTDDCWSQKNFDPQTS